MVDFARVGRTLGSPRTGAGVRDVTSGSICSVLSVAYGLSYAALIFTGPLSPWLSQGIAATFLSTAVAGVVVAWRSSLPFAVAGPDASTSAVVATLAAATAERLVSAGDTALLAPTLIAMALATGCTGLLLLLLGGMRAGRAIRYVPYPVVGGFMGATGWLMVTGAVRVIADHRPEIGSFSSFGTFVEGTLLAKLLAGAVVAAALEALLARSRSPIALPAVLLATIAAVHGGLAVAGLSVADGQALGWLFHPQAAAAPMLPWQPDALAAFPWQSIPWLAGDVLAVMFVTTVGLLLNTSGVEIATRREADIDRDLKVHGTANLLTAALGGYVTCLSLSRTTLNHALGGRSRMSGLTVAAISSLLLVADPALLGFVPKCALGGLLLFAGARLLRRWIVQSARQLRPVEYGALIAVAVIIVQWGFIAGVVIGVVIGCATFAVSASRVNTIKFGFDGSEYRSRLDRGSAELAILARHGAELQGMTLQSYLFFGSANRLYRHVKALLRQAPECRFLVFDFRLVTGIDSSAMYSFSQIKLAADQHGARLVLVSLAPELQRALEAGGLLLSDVVVHEDLDRALESCEDAIIAGHRTESREPDSLHGWLAAALGSADHADALVARCRRIVVGPGDVIARQGEPADSMLFILEGRVAIFVDTGDGRAVRVRSLGRHTTIGEMGLITGCPRSATMQAEAPSELFELDAASFDEIQRSQPALGRALLAYLTSVMADRLSFASRLIGVLQR